MHADRLLQDVQYIWRRRNAHVFVAWVATTVHYLAGRVFKVEHQGKFIQAGSRGRAKPQQRKAERGRNDQHGSKNYVNSNQQDIDRRVGVHKISSIAQDAKTRTFAMISSRPCKGASHKALETFEICTNLGFIELSPYKHSQRGWPNLPVK
jgi:hypothetical protein